MSHPVTTIVKRKKTRQFLQIKTESVTSLIHACNVRYSLYRVPYHSVNPATLLWTERVENDTSLWLSLVVSFAGI